MKTRFLAVVIMACLMLSLCACGGERFSASGDPIAFFAERKTWSLSEAKSYFGKPNSQEEYNTWGYKGITYCWDECELFGKAWCGELNELEGAGCITGASFEFNQGTMKDEAFESYFRSILDYYTTEYGKPDAPPMNHELYAWEMAHMTFILEYSPNYGLIVIGVSINSIPE